MSALLQRLLTPVMGVALVLALITAGVQWRTALIAKAETDRVAAAFDRYRADTERNRAAALAQAAAEKARNEKSRQEALDAEHLARVAAQADADRLRAGNGQLQRLASDLSTSLGDRARDASAPTGCQATEARIQRLAFMVGALDDFAAGAVAAADDSRIRGELCERTYDALRQ